MNEHQIKRIVYSNCNIDDHTTEPLSRVCIDDKCKNKTLICSLCEQLNHKGHKTVPLKTILTKMTSECNFENAGINPLYFTNIIDQCRSNFFSLIADKRQQINSFFNDIENLGKIYFNKIEQTTLNLLQVQNPMKYLNTNDSRNAKKLKEYFAKMMNLLNFESKNGFSLQKKLNGIVEACKSKEKRIIEAFNPLMSQFEKSAKKITVFLEGETVFSSSQNPIFFWSNTYKGAKVKINDLAAEQTGMQSSGQRFALLQPSLSEYGLKKLQWGIKVKKFAGWVGVGICLRSMIEKANYHFNYTNIGHGSYLISSNGYSWSHSVKELNSAYKTFQFAINDIVYMQFDPIENKLRFRKNQSNEKFELDIVPPPVGDTYAPCVNLCNSGDSVQLVNPGFPLS